MLGVAVVAGIIIQSCERTFVSPTLAYQDYSYFINPIWLCLVTMTTVGYGDFYPRTPFGRTAGVLVCLCGMVSVSLLVIFL
jgi:potassium intermediate/small conductance calcium-activated channel subfamily N protein 2